MSLINHFINLNTMKTITLFTYPCNSPDPDRDIRKISLTEEQFKIIELFANTRKDGGLNTIYELNDCRFMIENPADTVQVEKVEVGYVRGLSKKLENLLWEHLKNNPKPPKLILMNNTTWKWLLLETGQMEIAISLMDASGLAYRTIRIVRSNDIAENEFEIY